jgi:hypothetical protein
VQENASIAPRSKHVERARENSIRWTLKAEKGMGAKAVIILSALSVVENSVGTGDAGFVLSQV